MADKVVEAYEQGLELEKAGRKEDAVAAYERGFELVKQSGGADAQSRLKTFAGKLAPLHWSLENDDKAKVYFEIMGFPVPRRQSEMPLSKRIKVLQKNGLLTGFTGSGKARILKELAELYDSEDDVEVVEVLKEFYKTQDRTPSQQSLIDGCLCQLWQTDDDPKTVVRNFARILGGEPPLFMHPEDNGTDSRNTLTRRDGQTFTVKFQTPIDVADFFNEQLAKVGDRRRFVSCDSDDLETYVFLLCTSDRYKNIFLGNNRVITTDRSAEEKLKRWAYR
jgi:hypothetical protein